MDNEILMNLFEISDNFRLQMKKQKKEPNSEGLQKPPSGLKGKMTLSMKNTLRILLYEENINQRSLAKRVNLTAQAMSDIIKKLEQAEFITRKNNKINNEYLISLTEKGVIRAKMFDEVVSQTSERLFNVFTEEEKKVFLDLLLKLKGKSEGCED